MSEIRISQRRIEELERIISDRDKAILLSLQDCRYLTTGQIKRLHFADKPTHLSGLRATNRGLVKLKGYGLITHLNRRIGGVRGGSGSLVSVLTKAGVSLLGLINTDNTPRKRTFDPSPAFLEHTLAVAETYIQFIEICKRNNLELVESELEPASWRKYVGTDGKSVYLKPDIFAVTASGDYEDCWFVEVDLATESPNVVVGQCLRYARYHKTEFGNDDTFPLVVWIVPSVTRKESLKRHIAESKDLSIKNAFVVITPDELEPLLTEGRDGK